MENEWNKKGNYVKGWSEKQAESANTKNVHKVFNENGHKMLSKKKARAQAWKLVMRKEAMKLDNWTKNK